MGQDTYMPPFTTDQIFHCYIIKIKHTKDFDGEAVLGGGKVVLAGSQLVTGL